jgi:hypothetical protein
MEAIKTDEILINRIFNKDEINMEEFSIITVDLLNFPKMFNSVLFNKINVNLNKNKISKHDFQR